MSAPISNPPNPYVGDIPGGFGPGKLIRIQGNVPPTAKRFNINLQCGPNVSPRDDVGLHISVRLTEGYIARNSLERSAWGDEQGRGALPIGPGQMFEILVLCDASQYKLAVNGQHFCEFPVRIPLQRISHLSFDGDVSISIISYEGGVSTSLNSAPPPGGQVPGGPGDYYGAPPHGQYGGGPPGGYGGGPHGGYGGPGPYGQPGPPPGYDQQGKESDSGFGDIFGQAGTAIAGVLASGGLSSLLSNVGGGGGGGQQQSGAGGASHIPPPPPPPQGGFGSLGSLGSLLGGVLSNNAAPQQPQQPQFGGQGQVGGLGSLGSILGGVLADNLLNPKKDGRH